MGFGPNPNPNPNPSPSSYVPSFPFYDAEPYWPKGGYGHHGGGDCGDSDKSKLSTVSITITPIGNVGCSDEAVCVGNEDHLYILTNSLNGGSKTHDLIVVNGRVTFECYTTAPITTYSGDITLGTAEHDSEGYITPVTITGDCSLTLQGGSIS